MQDSDIARIIYLGILIVAVGGYMIVHFRGRMLRGLQQAALWGLIFLGVAAGARLWEDLKPELTREAVITAEDRIVVPQGPDGHYHLTLDVNGTPVNFLIDTGASAIVLSRADARRIGLDTDRLKFYGRAQTANGMVETAPVVLDRVALGPHEERRVKAQVNGGNLEGSLLGMRYLDRFARIEISGDRLTLWR